MVLYDGLKEDCGVTMVFCIHPDRRFAHAARATPGPPGLSSSALRLTACAMERRRRATISVQCEVEGLELKLELSEGETEGAEPWSGALLSLGGFPVPLPVGQTVRYLWGQQAVVGNLQVTGVPPAPHEDAEVCFL